MEKYKVEYGGTVYEQCPLNFSDTLQFGTTIMPKLAGFASTIGAIVSDKAVVTSEVYSFYKSIQEIFSPEEWMFLIKLFLLNEKNLLIVNGQPLSTDEIEKHFSGDLLRAYRVSIGLAIKNLGESSPFMASLQGFGKNIAVYLEEAVKEKLETIENGLQKTAKGNPKK